MRRLYTSLVVAATLVPVLALAADPNQRMADQIGAHLWQSGKLHHYKLVVKFKDGTAWLQGQVHDQRQANIALHLAMEPEGVQRVVNNLTIESSALLPAPVPGAVPDLGAVKQVSNTEPVPEGKQAGEEAASPEEQPGEEEGVSQPPEQSPRPMQAFFQSLRRPAAGHGQALPMEDPVVDPPSAPAPPAPILKPFRQWEQFSKHADEVKIVESRMEFVEDQAGPAVLVVGKVKNLSSVDWKNVRFQVEFFNSKGELFDASQQEVYGWQLPAGQDTTFKISLRRPFPAKDYAACKVRVITAADSKRWL
ncbi:MAG: BON domain-containing protein [Thermoguttaceae bacterium]